MCNSSRNLFESLEDRLLFSAVLDSNGDDAGTLRIVGGLGADTIVIETLEGIEKRLRVSQTTQGVKRNTLFPRDQVVSIEVSLRDGNDMITNNTGVPTFVYAGAGNDTITGGFGNDQLFGDLDKSFERGVFEPSTFGNDVIRGNDGNDLIDGNKGNDELHGEIGNDTLTGGFGTDKLFGGIGDDLLKARDASLLDVVDGGSGTDTAEVDRLLVSTIGIGGPTLSSRLEPTKLCERVVGSSAF